VGHSGATGSTEGVSLQGNQNEKGDTEHWDHEDETTQAVTGVDYANDVKRGWGVSYPGPGVLET
jgi:hypothetical protein